MGFDIERVIGENKDLLKCPICEGVVEDAIQMSCCQQFYCRKCINRCLLSNIKKNGNCHCPGRSRRKIVKVSRIVEQLVDSLTIKCQNMKNGCPTVCKLSQIGSHEKTCEYMIAVLVRCECGLQISRQDSSHHKCVKILNQKIKFMDKTIAGLQTELRKLKYRMGSPPPKKVVRH